VKLKTVSVTYGRKINLGDYNNANLEMTVGAELEDGDNEDDEMSALWEKAKTSVKEQLHHLISAYKNKENPQ